MNGVVRNVVLALADTACILLSWSFVVWSSRAVGLTHYKLGALSYFCFWPVMVAFVVINGMFRLYHGRFFHPGVQLNPVEEFRRLVGSSVIVHAGTLAVLALTFQTTEGYSRLVIVLSGLFVALMAQPIRNLVRALMRKMNFGQVSIRLIGDPVLLAAIGDEISGDAYQGFRPTDDGADLVLACGELGKVDLSTLIAEHRHVAFIPSGGVLPTVGAQPVSFGGFGGIEIVNQRRIGALRHEKWLVDKLLATLVFVLSFPLFILIPLAIKLTSKGPVFYRHHRLGKCGRPMRVWKCRSMYMDADERLKKVLEADPDRKAEWETKFKLADDPRVTPLGRFLRKTSLDELPQLFNVFAGEMALVGPRPIVEEEVVRYGASYEIFSSVRPGVTGLWQCSGRSDTGYERRVALDVHYVLNWSPWMDLWILRRTLAVVLAGKGAT